ncbi:MAG: hypothetical protein NTY53_22080 [Kiritimatiellaeota bacterium]|nr:hypothetical protein [Kiritimatiellota bacterium]
MAKNKWVVVTAALVVVAIGLLGFLGGREFLRGPRSFFLGFERGMQKSYESIKIGTAKGDVLAGPGKPMKTEAVFCLPQKSGFESLFTQAEHSTAIEFCLWHKGGNWYYCVGFDKDGKVAFKGEGNS